MYRFGDRGGIFGGHQAVCRQGKFADNPAVGGYRISAAEFTQPVACHGHVRCVVAGADHVVCIVRDAGGDGSVADAVPFEHADGDVAVPAVAFHRGQACQSPPLPIGQGCFACEKLSLHQFDGHLFHRIGQGEVRCVHLSETDGIREVAARGGAAACRAGETAFRGDQPAVFYDIDDAVAGVVRDDEVGNVSFADVAAVFQTVETAGVPGGHAGRFAPSEAQPAGHADDIGDVSFRCDGG